MSIKVTDEIKNFLNDFIAHSNQEHLSEFKFEVWKFGNTKEMANSLGELVYRGIKTATCSLLRAYDKEEDQIPRVGIYSVLVDGDNKPLAIVFRLETFIKAFSEIDQEFAYLEGEGDRSYEYWRKAHLEYFSQVSGFTEDDLLICEKFEVVYKK